MAEQAQGETGGAKRPVTPDHLQRGLRLRAGRGQVLVVGDADSEDDPEDIEIDWTFQHDDGTPLAGERYTLHFADGSTRTGALEAGRLVAKVPPHEHLAVDIEGYGHVEGESDALKGSGDAAEPAADAADGAPQITPAGDGFVDISWEFRHPDGTPLGDEPYVLHFADGTTREGTLSGGRLEAHVPDEHLAVDIEGFVHLEVDA